MDFFRVECFLKAAEVGNMTKAAEQMNITQSAMSFQIREFEREVQLSLFERDRSGIVLTPSGRVMRDGLMQLLDSYHRVLSEARACAHAKPRLTIGYHGPVDWAGINRFIADFSEKHPEIELAILQQQWKELASYLELGVLDVAFLAEEETLGSNSLLTIPLFRELTCFAVAPSHPLAGHESVRKEALAGETFFMNNHPSKSMTATIEKLVASGISLQSFRFCDQLDVTLAMAASCQGIAPIPRSFKMNSSALRYVDFDTESCWMAYSLAWNRKAQNDALDIFRAEVQKAKWPYEGASA